jgi:prepilin-type N-terminal cleavage/methylation domain-containing protein
LLLYPDFRGCDAAGSGEPRMKPPKVFFNSLRPGGSGNCGRAQAGFSLLELMAVLGLMALLLGLVLPGLLHSWEREKNRATLREFTTALRTARSEAVTRGLRVRLFLNLKTGRYRLEGSNREGALMGLNLTDARLVWQNPEKSQGYISFYGDGSTSGGELVLVEPTGRRYLLEVEPITGKVSLRSSVN